MTYPTSICTLDDVHSQLSIPSTDTSNDALLVRYINAATDYVNYISGTILPTVFTNEVHNGGTSRIKLFNAPILTVASVIEYVGLTAYTLVQSERGGTINPYSYSIDNAEQGYLSRVWSGMVGPFVGGDNNIVVTYTAGYATVPDSIWLATLQDIQVLYQQTKYGGDLSGVGDTQDSFGVTPINAFPRLANLLTGSRRVQAIA